MLLSKSQRQVAIREKYPYSKLFWSAFSRIWTEYRETLRISPYPTQIREKTDQNKELNKEVEIHEFSYKINENKC